MCRFDSYTPCLASFHCFVLLLFGNGVRLHVMYNPTVHKGQWFDSVGVKSADISLIGKAEDC